MLMFIDGERVGASDGKTFDILNSATLELIDTVPSATEEDVERAIQAARKGKKVWGALTTHERADIMCRAAAEVDARQDELTISLSEETGKIRGEARGEIRVCAQILRGYAEQANHLYGQTMTDYQKGVENDIIFTRREPLGVIAAIAPFNYPVELCYQKIGAALAAGNAVIAKPASDNPLTIMKIADILWRAGVPGNVLQVITGSGSRLGKILSESPLIDGISITGSTAAGVDVATRGVKTLKNVYGELGGNDPFLVFADCDMELAMDAAFQGRVQNAGQTCCAPKRFIVEKSIKDQFIQGLLDRIATLKIGNPADETVQMGSLISESATQNVQKMVDETIAQGAKLVCGGKMFNRTYFEPTILDDITDAMPVAHDMEIFGPVFPIMAFETEEEAIRMANDTVYGLQAGVMTKDISRAMRVASKLECGGVVINGSGNYRDVDQPYGGTKHSGIGREGLCCTLQNFTQEKSYILKNVLN